MNGFSSTGILGERLPSKEIYSKTLETVEGWDPKTMKVFES